jgi:hypothetical protein
MIADFLNEKTWIVGDIVDAAIYARYYPQTWPLLLHVLTNINTMTYSHTPETYISWMESLDAETLAAMQKLIAVTYRCPVDVYIYDDGALVGKVINNEVDENIRNTVQIVVEGDEKTVYLAGDAEYEIKLVGTDNGVMNCSISEILLANGEERRINFYEIPLTVGETMTTVINPSNFGIPEDDYALFTSAGESILPDEVLSGNDVEDIEIIVSSSSGGTAIGNQRLSIGDRAYLSATASDGYRFIGWFENGVLSSTNADYSFIAMGSHSFEARFNLINTSGSAPTPELVQITHTRQGALQYDYPTALPGGNNRAHFTAAVLDMLPESRLLIFGGNTWYDVSGVTLSEAVTQNRIGAPVGDYQAVLENGAVTSPAAADIIRRINRAYPLTEENLQPIYAVYLALSETERAAIANDEAVRDMLALMG